MSPVTAGPAFRPTRTREQQILAEADRVQAALNAQRCQWDRGFTRRSFLAGSGMVVAATLASQLVTTRHSYAETMTGNGKTLVVVFLRGGLDGLTTVVPRNNARLQSLRPGVGIPDSSLLAMDNMFGLHPAMQAVYPLWKSGQLGFVHGVGSAVPNRDHFASQALMERGSASLTAPTGWLDRVLALDGPGTTFRAVCEGAASVAALKASAEAVAMKGIDTLVFNNPSPQVADALRALYTGLDSPFDKLMVNTVQAVGSAGPVKAVPNPLVIGADYAVDDFGKALADIARLVKVGAGLRVATVDVGGWDLHSAIGTVAAGSMVTQLQDLSKSLAAFVTDLGSRIADVTVVLMSEFGRRVEENGSGGTDHGFGGLMMLLGGKVIGGQVHGNWPGLQEQDLISGDLAVVNDYRDVLGEVAQKTLGLGSLTGVFPGYTVRPLNVMR